MSVYGCVPLSEAHRLVQPYAIASPASWTFRRRQSPDPDHWADFAGVEDYAFSPAQLAELAALGGHHFPDAPAFSAWLYQFG